MVISERKEAGSIDSKEVALYAKRDANSEITYPILINDDGSLNISGFNIPPYDEIDITYVGTSTTISTVVYYKSAASVATITLTYTGSNLIKVAKT